MHVSIKILHENTFTEWVWGPSVFRACSPNSISWCEAFSALISCITTQPLTFKSFFQIRVIWILTSDRWIKKNNCDSVELIVVHDCFPKSYTVTSTLTILNLLGVKVYHVGLCHPSKYDFTAIVDMYGIFWKTISKTLSGLNTCDTSSQMTHHNKDLIL